MASQKSNKLKSIFVGMWFDSKMEFLYNDVFKPVINDLGFKDIRIDREKSYDIRTDSQIDNEISKSKCVIIDLTAEFNKENKQYIPRGSVYFEAGFAKGKGVPVIWTCRKDIADSGRLPFNISGFPILSWEKAKKGRWKKKNLTKIQKDLKESIEGRLELEKMNKSVCDSSFNEKIQHTLNTDDTEAVANSSKQIYKDKKPKKDFDIFKELANQGDPVAQFNVALMYQNGDGVDPDPEKAFEWYEKSANQGYADAQNSLGTIYKEDKDKKDHKKAFEWFKKSADQEHKMAQYNLGTMYCFSEYTKKDHKKAFELFEKSAHQGLKEAQFNVALMYKKGYGVDPDPEKAFEWYEKSANQGYADAQNSLGTIYKEDKDKKDHKKAFEWFKKSADQEHKMAQYNLGIMYYHIQYGRQDHKKAFELLEKSAHQGLKEAQFSLGVMYIFSQLDGKILRDNVQAYKWLSLSLEKGHKEAQWLLTKIQLDMKPEQIQEAKRLILEFKKKYEK